jgi:hypothetical protein
VEALVAGAALRRAGDDDPIAALDAPHLGSDGFDYALSAVIGNGGSASLGRAESAADARITRSRGFRADDDLSRLNRLELQIFEADPRSVPHEASEPPAGIRSALDRRR